MTAHIQSTKEAMVCIITFQFLIVSYFHSVHNHTKQILRHEANGSNGVKSKSLGVGFHRVFLDSKAVVDPVFLWLRAMTKFGFGGFFFIFFIVIAWVGTTPGSSSIPAFM